MTIATSSAEETRAAASEFARQLHGGEFVTLIGDLGAGKTTFTQGLVAGLGSTARVKSPTFTVMNEYRVDDHPTIKKVAHIDFYRFTTESELRALELDEYRRNDVVIVAEWPNALPTVEWPTTFEVALRGTSETTREIVITKK